MQKMTKVALKAIFTKFEYFLLKRQKQFVLDSQSSDVSDDDYFKSNGALKESFEMTERTEQLLTGAIRQTTSKGLTSIEP